MEVQVDLLLVLRYHPLLNIGFKTVIYIYFLTYIQQSVLCNCSVVLNLTAKMHSFFLLTLLKHTLINKYRHLQ